MTGRWPPDPIPFGYSTLREIVANLEKAIIGREPFCAEDLAEIGAEPPQKRLEAVLADMRQRGVRGERADLEARARTIISDFTTDRIRSERVLQVVRGALSSGDLTAVVRDSATGEMFRIPAGIDWLLAEDSTFRKGELFLKGGAPSAQHNGRLVLVREADAESFVKKWVASNCEGHHDTPCHPFTPLEKLSPVSPADLMRFIRSEAEQARQREGKPAYKDVLKDAAKKHFRARGNSVPKRRFETAYTELDRALKRAPGDTDNTIKRRSAS